MLFFIYISFFNDFIEQFCFFVYNIKLNMKILAIFLNLITFTLFSQEANKDTLLDNTDYIIDDEIKPKCDDRYLRMKFHKVFTDPKIWKDFITGHENKSIWVEAPETNWYDKNIGPDKSNKFYLCLDPIMIDSTVINYYDTKIKGFKYDTYSYAIEHQRDGTIREYYNFYINGYDARGYMIGWYKTEITTISDFDFPERK